MWTLQFRTMVEELQQELIDSNRIGLRLIKSVFQIYWEQWKWYKLYYRLKNFWWNVLDTFYRCSQTNWKLERMENKTINYLFNGHYGDRLPSTEGGCLVKCHHQVRQEWREIGKSIFRHTSLKIRCLLPSTHLFLLSFVFFPHIFFHLLHFLLYNLI